MPFEKGNDTGDTLFINTSNLYISKQEDIDRIYNQVVGLEIDNISTNSIIGDPSIDPWDYIQYTHTDEEGNTINTFTSLAQYSLEFNGVFKQNLNTTIDREKKKVNSTFNSNSTKINRLKQEIDTTNASLKITAEQVDELQKDITVSKTASGNPIEVTDAGEYPLESIGIDGKSYQKTTTGKNKFINIESATYAGITLTHNSDDSYDIVGTSTSTGNIFFQKDIAIEKAMLKDNTHYIISFSQEIDADKILIVSEFYGNGQYKRRLVSSTADYRIGLSNLTDVDTFRCYIMIKVGQTVNIKGLKIQVEEGQVATDIEPYTGGIPSPNPEYPQEIKTVQGITNLFDVNEYTLANKIITHAASISIEEDELILNCRDSDAYVGAVNANSGADYTEQYGKLFEIDNITYSAKVTNPQFTKNYIQFWDKDKKTIAPYQTFGGHSYITFTPPANAKYVTFRFGKGASVNGEELRTKVTLVKGTMPEQYVPKGRWLKQITIGKNKFDENYPVENYYYNLNGNRVADTTGYINQKYLPVNNKLSFSLSQKNGNAFIRLCEYKDNNTFIKRTLINSNTTITLSNETKYVIWSVDKSSSNYFVDLQIEEGEITPYEEYKENIALIDMNKPNLFEYETSTNIEWYTDIPNFIKETGIYTLEINNPPSTGNWSAYFVDEQKNRVGDFIKPLSSVYEKSTFLVSESQIEAPYIRFLPSASGQHDLKNYGIKIYEGYDPYYEFVGIDEVKDEFLDGVLTKNIQKLVLTGNEVITANSPTGRYDIIVQNSGSGSTNNPLAISNYYIGKYALENNVVFCSATPNLITIIDQQYATLDSFRACLKERYSNGNPVIIYYVMAKPKTYQLKYEPLKLHKGYNYITLNDDLYPNMEIKYLTDSKFNAEYMTHAQFEIESNRINSEINTKVSNTELDEVIEEQTNKIEQEITDTTNSINLSVTQKINDIQIGGTNLLLGTEKPMSSGTSSGTNQVTQLYKFSDFFNTNYKSKIDTNEGLLVTCSFDWETTGTSGSFSIMLMGWPYTGLSKTITIFENSKKGHSELTNTMKKVANHSTNFSYVAIRRDNMTTSVKISNMKIELGNKATDWSSAPEDKLDNSKFNKAEIIAEINNGVSNVKIFAENIQLANFVISGGKLTSLVTTKYNFTQSDVTKVRELIMEGSWTTAELNKYDINKNGKIDANDYISIKGIVDGNISTSKPGKFEINTNQDDYTHKGLIYGYDGDGVEKISIGLGESKLTNLNVKGTLTSSSDLNVAGSGTITGGIATNGNIMANGSVYSNALPVITSTGSGTYLVKNLHIEPSPRLYLEVLTDDGVYGIDAWPSDKRLKRRIKDSKYDALDTLMKIKHRQFIYRKTNEKVLIGYVADELQELDPNMVFEVGPQKIKQPNPPVIIPILSKAIQEQQEIIGKQDKRITELEDQVKKILELVEGKK